MTAEFRWVGDRLSFKKHNRNYYDRVQRADGSDAPDARRTFRVGDTVAVTGEDAKTWIAHILELFQCLEDDPELKDSLDADRQRNPSNEHILMRCTLRWFYALNDLSKTSLLDPRVPSHIPKEVYFSDHVEKEGFNDITVIEGRAFMFESRSALKAFEKEPADNFNPQADALCIVRCIVDCNSAGIPARRLKKAELKHLIDNPSKREDLFHDKGPPPSKASASGSAAQTPNTTRRRPVRRTVTESDEDDEDEDYVQPAALPVEEDPPEEAVESDSESSSPRPRIGRKKVQFNADEQEDSSDSSSDDDDEPLNKTFLRKSRKSEAPASRHNSKRGKTKRKERRKSHPTNERRQGQWNPRASTPPPEPPEHAEETLEEAQNNIGSFIDDLNAGVEITEAPRNPFDIGGASNGGNATPKPSSQQAKKKKKSKARKLSTEVQVISSDSNDDKAVQRKGDSRSRTGPPKKTSGAPRDSGNDDGRANGRTGAGPSGGKSVFVQNERKKAVAARAGARNALARDGHDGRTRRNGKGDKGDEEGGRRKFVTPIGRNNLGKKNGGVSKGIAGDSEMEGLMDELARRFSEMSMDGRQVFLKKMPVIMKTLATAMDEERGRDGRGGDRKVESRLADDLAQTLKMRRVGKGGDGSVGGEAPVLLSTG